MSNVTNLYAWQICLEFNLTFLGFTLNDVWVPKDSVFKGFPTIPVNATLENGALFYGYTITGPYDGVSVGPDENVTLFNVNFTAKARGYTYIEIVPRGGPLNAKGEPIFPTALIALGPPPWYKPIEMPWESWPCLVLIGTNAPLLFLPLPPLGCTQKTSKKTLYTEETIAFNASESYDPDGEITRYVWFINGKLIKNTTESSFTYNFTTPGVDNNGLRNSTWGIYPIDYIPEFPSAMLVAFLSAASLFLIAVVVRRRSRFEK